MVKEGVASVEEVAHATGCHVRDEAIVLWPNRWCAWGRRGGPEGARGIRRTNRRLEWEKYA